jgi:molybdopterin synthase sulfur carrier subunit
LPTIHIPAPLRSLTGGQSSVTVSGKTLGEIADALEGLFPGIKARITEGARVRPGLAVFADSIQVSSDLATKVAESADIYFAPAISGGSTNLRVVYDGPHQTPVF